MERYFPPDHPNSLALDVMIGGFNDGKVGQSIVVDLMWGLKGIDKSDVYYYNASDIGEPLWDEEFDMTPSENQLYLYNFCQMIKKKNEMLFHKGSITCWLENFKKYLDRKKQDFPIEKTKSRTQEENFMYWLNRFVKESKLGRAHVTSTDIGIVDGKLKYMKFVAKSAGEVFAPYDIKIVYWQMWEDLKDEYNKKAPKGINGVIQTAGLDWCIIIMELRLVETMQ